MINSLQIHLYFKRSKFNNAIQVFFLTLYENGLFRSLTYLFHTSFIASLFLISLSFISLCLAEPQDKSTISQKWVETWSTAPQLVETANNPQAPGLSNNTIRQIVHPSISGAFGPKSSAKVTQDLIAAYGQLINKAHARNIRIYGTTLLPFGSSFYVSPDHQKAWQTVNDWICHSGCFDAVIDLDSAMHDPANSTKLLPAYRLRRPSTYK